VPDSRFVETFVNQTYDKITLTNTSTVTIPAGTTITWTVHNSSSAADTITLSSLAGVSSTTTSLTIAAGVTATITLTTTAAIAPGGSVSWQYNAAHWNFQGRVTMSFAGTTLATCPSVSGCVSIFGSNPGTACPTTALAAAKTADPVRV